MRDSEGFRRSSVLLVAVMLSIVTGFVAATLYTRVQLSHSAELESVASNAAPSIELLAAARGFVHRLMADANRAVVLSTPLPTDRQEREALMRTLDAYYALPTYYGEKAAQDALRADIAELDRLLAQARAAAVPSQRSLVLDRLDPLATRLDDETLKLIELNTQHLTADAGALRRSRRHDDFIAFSLDAVVFVLALLATGLVLRVMRRYFMVVERRSRELEYFAVQVAHDIFNPLTPVGLGLQLALESARNRDETAAIERAVRGVERIRHAVEGLHAFALAGGRSRPGEHASLRTAVDEAMQPLDGRSRVVVEPFSDREVACSPAVLSRAVRAFIGEALTRAEGAAVHLRVGSSGHRARIELALERGRIGADVFSPEVRGPTSGYPGINLEMPTVRRMIESHGGSVGARHARLWLELPIA